MLDGYPFPDYSVPTMKMNSDSATAIKTQINTLAFQLKSIKTMEANAHRLNLTDLVKSFRIQRNQLTNNINALIGHANSTSGFKSGNRVWLSNITSGKVKPYGRAFDILARSK